MGRAVYQGGGEEGVWGGQRWAEEKPAGGFHTLLVADVLPWNKVSEFNVRDRGSSNLAWFVHKVLQFETWWLRKQVMSQKLLLKKPSFVPVEGREKGIDGLVEEEEVRRFEAKTAQNCSTSASRTGAPLHCPPPEHIVGVELLDFEKISN